MGHTRMWDECFKMSFQSPSGFVGAGLPRDEAHHTHLSRRNNSHCPTANPSTIRLANRKP